MTPEAGRLAARLASLLGAVPDPEIRARAAEREIAGAPPLDLLRALEHLLARAAARDPRAGIAVSALGRALTDMATEQRGELRRAARELELPGVAAWLASGIPLRSPRPDDLRDPPGLEGVSLGHRKVLARNRDPDVIARVARSAEPSVVRNLLENPRLTEADVVRLAAQRPIRPASLEEIARSRRFEARPAVRRALVRNPYAPVELALRLVPHLLAPELRDVAVDRSLHPAVREEALRVLAARADRHGIAARERIAAREAEEARRQAEAEHGDERLDGELLALCEEIEAGVTLRRVDD